MNATPRPIAIHPARLARAGFPAPIACPTATAAAAEIPSGTINVYAAQLNAISCVASATGSRCAAMIVTAPNAATSSTTWNAAGTPRFSNTRTRVQSGPGQCANSGCPRPRSCRHAKYTSTAAI